MTSWTYIHTCIYILSLYLTCNGQTRFNNKITIISYFIIKKRNIFSSHEKISTHSSLHINISHCLSTFSITHKNMFSLCIHIQHVTYKHFTRISIFNITQINISLIYPHSALHRKTFRSSIHIHHYTDKTFHPSIHIHHNTDNHFTHLSKFSITQINISLMYPHSALHR